MPERSTRRATTARTPRVVRTISGTVRSSKAPKSKSGVPITDELADQLAEEAERGYDLSRGRRVGRKSLGGHDGQSPRLNIRTTREVYDRAVEMAVREGKTLSEIAREALEKHVKQPSGRASKR